MTTSLPVNNVLIFIFFFLIPSVQTKQMLESTENSTTSALNENDNRNISYIKTSAETLNVSTDIHERFSEQTIQKFTPQPTTSLTTVKYNVLSTSKPKIATTTSLADDGAKADDCFTTIEATSGHIFSPVYDEKKKILQCDWMIIVPDDYVTRLKFLTFDLPLMSNDRCLDGFILYGSYDNKNRRVNGHDMCGNDIPEVYVSISNRIWIYFQIINHAKSKFELIFDAVPVEKHEGSNLSLLALLVIVIPLIAAVSFCYVKKQRREKQKRVEVRVYDRFRQKHQRNKTLLMTKKVNNGEKNNQNNQNSVKIRVSRPSDDFEDSHRKFFDPEMSSIRGSGDYAMTPGQFCVHRVIMPSAASSTDGSVFLKDTPEAQMISNCGSSLSYNSNFLSIPSKFGHRTPLPSYLSLRQPASDSSTEGSLKSITKRKMKEQTKKAMFPNNKTIGSLESIAELPPYKDPPPYFRDKDGSCYNGNKQLPVMVSDTSVFSNEHPKKLDKRQKRRKTDNKSASFIASNSSRKRSKGSMTCNDGRNGYRTALFSRCAEAPVDSYRPGTGHPTFLSTSNFHNMNNFVSSTNLQRGKWEDIHCLNDSGYKFSQNSCCSLQNLTEMKEMCKTMPIIHVSSFSSIIQEHNTLSYSAHALNHATTEMGSNSTSNNENMSLINEEGDVSVNKEFDNPAFVLDESPLNQNKQMQFHRTCSLDENRSFVDLNNNTQFNDTMGENKSFIVNDFYPGENHFIVLDRGETIV
ncbi:Hypothetical predicted protein [Mytilus galloprovincialis]|uniref:CUB domain-containing protein n=2 Tax=Mytilus galloprovincialis TaxID=29158 RepID=A0A8B6HQM2_MYTGA|nr:Hypothetical predicted protein [Mytilus galloprovincialis]